VTKTPVRPQIVDETREVEPIIPIPEPTPSFIADPCSVTEINKAYKESRNGYKKVLLKRKALLRQLYK